MLKILLFAMFLGSIGAVIGQETSAPTELSQDLVTARIQALRDAGGQEVDESILSSYQQVLNWLGEAKAHAAAETSFLNALNTAPEAESEIRARMESTDYRAAEIDLESVSRLKSADIQDQLTVLRVKLRDTNEAKDQFDKRISSEQSSGINIQTRFESIDKRLQELPASTINIEPNLAPSKFEVAEWLVLAERTALTAQKRALEAQLTSQPARYSQYAAASAELALKLQALNFAIETLESELASHDEEADTELSIDLDENAPGYELVQSLFTDNDLLRARSSARGEELKALKETDDLLKQTHQSLQNQYEAVQQIVELANDSPSLGYVLMGHWHQTDAYRLHDKDLGDTGDIGEAVIQRARHEEEQEKITSAADYVQNELIDGTGLDVDEKTMEAAKNQVRVRRQLLRELVAFETESINIQGSIARNNEQLESTLSDYKKYLRSRILWIPSHPSITQFSVSYAREAFGDLVDNLSRLNIERPKPFTTVLLIFVLAGFLLRKKMIRYAQELSGKIGRVREDSIRFTVIALLLTLIRSVLPSLLLVLLAGNLFMDGSGDRVAPYLEQGLFISAQTLFILMLLRIACEDKGLAEVHFSLPRTTCMKINRTASWLLWAWWPLGLITGFIFRLEVESFSAIFGRLSWFVALAVVGIALARLSWPKSDSSPANRHWRKAGALAILAITSFYLVSILLGYIYTAEIHYESMVSSLLMGSLLLLFYFFMQRWILITRRKLRFQELVSARKVTDHNRDWDDESRESDLVTLSKSVGQLLRSATLLLGAIGITLIWAPIFQAMEAMERVTLWTVSEMSEGEAIITTISLASLVLALLIAGAAVYAAHSIPRLLDLLLRSWKSITPGSRYASVKLVQYIIIGTGIIAFLSILGLRWDRLQWLVAALSVGIGFGLQEIIANFISGLILLFERPIRRGDVVTVGDSSGEVIRIRIRATLIRDFDGKELLVPNKEFVTGRLLNWTLSDNCIRVIVNVGIAYGSDVRKAVAVIEQALNRNELVLKHPEHDVVFREFGDSSLNLMVRCFINNVDQRWALIDELHHAINDGFAEAGIVIAFPQLDVHLDRSDSADSEESKFPGKLEPQAET